MDLAEQPAPLIALLGSSGLQLEIGPFLARIRSEWPAVADHISELYADFPRRNVPEGHFDVAVVRGRRLHRWIRPQADLVINSVRPYLPLPAVLAGPAMEWALNWCVGKKAHQWLTLHAAVVERGGRAMMLPAPPGSGKSTLCAALAYSGWRLFSDEFAIVSPVTGRLLPAPRPISLKEASIEIIKSRHSDLCHGPEGIDVEGARFIHARPPTDSVRRAHEDAPLGFVVFPRYAPGKRTTFEPVAKAQALVELAGQSFNFGYHGASAFDCLTRMVSKAKCLRLEYSDLDDVIGQLERLIAA
jgi:HprK-related kinase A